MISNLTITCYAGESLNDVPVPVRDSDGNTVDLTNLRLRMEVRPSPGGTLVLAMDTADGTLINNGTESTFTMNTTAPSITVNSLTSRFDAWYHDALGNLHPIAAGNFIIINPITGTLP
jgi:hypothetical protein